MLQGSTGALHRESFSVEKLLKLKETMSRKRKARRRTVKGADRSNRVRQSNQLSFEQLEARNLLATLVVNSTADLPVDLTDSVVTLRDAIEASNNDVLVAPGGEIGNGADTITFDASVFTGGSSSLIRLNGTELEITEELTIDGTTGAGVTITGDASNDDVTDSLNVTDVGASFGGTAGAFDDLLDDNSRVLNFSSLSGDLTLDGVTVTGGRTTVSNVYDPTIPLLENIQSGGGIRFVSNGLLSVNNSVVSGNSTAGVFADGGGIFTESGDVTLTNSTLSGNSTSGDYAYGGGVRSFTGVVTLTSSTLSGNSTAGVGSRGGGIFTFFGDVTLESSTLTGNEAALAAGGGAFINSIALQPTNFTIENSIVAGNLGSVALPNVGDASDFELDPDAQLTVNNSLIGATGLTIGGTGNQIGTLANPINPLLGPLTDNGGPTQTHALLPGSPAINAGDDSVTQTEDQRGLARNVNGVDIGAFELQPAGPPTVTSFTRDEGGVLDRPDLLNTISVSFDVDVSVGVDDLEIRNDTLGGSLVDTSGLIFDYDSSTRTATWDFGNLTLDPAFYSFELTSGIVSTAGNVSLDGDADGSPGGAYTESVYVALPGDANLDGAVDVLGDAFILVNNLGATGRTFTQGDFDGSGTVDVLGDAFILVNNLGQSVQLPATSQAFVQPPLAAIASAPSVSTSAAVVIEQADDEDEVVATTPRVAANATSPELSGDEVRDDAFASEFGSLDSFWV